MTYLDQRLVIRLALISLVVLMAIAVPVILIRQAMGGPRPISVVLPERSSSPSPTSTSKLPTTGATARCPSGQLVANADQLTRALAEAKPGTVIVLAAGTFS